jgi:hypothetical protein
VDCRIGGEGLFEEFEMSISLKNSESGCAEMKWGIFPV